MEPLLSSGPTDVDRYIERKRRLEGEPRFKRLKGIRFPLEEHFAMALSAPRRSGKSYFIRTLLTHGLVDRYDHIFVMCPSIHMNHDYDDFLKDRRFTFYAELNNSTIERIFQRQCDCRTFVNQQERIGNPDRYRCPNTLLILDDCVDSGVVDFRGIVDKIAERGRHCHLSLIASVQRMTALSRSIRINSDYVLIWSPFSFSETERFLEEFVSRDDKHVLREKLKELFDVQYQFILVDNTEYQHTKKLKTSNADDFVKNRVPLLLTSDDLQRIRARSHRLQDGRPRKRQKSSSKENKNSPAR